jgi:hypothetical protein
MAAAAPPLAAVAPLPPRLQAPPPSAEHLRYLAPAAEDDVASMLRDDHPASIAAEVLAAAAQTERVRFAVTVVAMIITAVVVGTFIGQVAAAGLSQFSAAISYFTGL